MKATIHKFYVGQFFNHRQGQTGIFAVTYADQIPICPRKILLLWATSPNAAKMVYGLMKDEYAAIDRNS